MDGNGDLLAYYVYDGAGLVAKVTPANAYYFYHYDGLGNTVAITDSSGAIANAYAYSPYGLVGSQETIENSFQYVGRFGVMAEGNGLYFMRARYYDPEVGRFINKDPIGYAGGMNLYGYVANNPINFIDPFGLVDIFVYVEGDLVVGLFGFEGGVGFVFDTDRPGESGFFATGGTNVGGVNYGMAGGAGFVFRELEGCALNIDANIPVASGQIIFDDSGFNGGAIGIAPPPLGGKGFSVSETHTSTYTVNDHIRYMKKNLESADYSGNDIGPPIPW